MYVVLEIKYFPPNNFNLNHNVTIHKRLKRRKKEGNRRDYPS